VKCARCGDTKLLMPSSKDINAISRLTIQLRSKEEGASRHFWSLVSASIDTRLTCAFDPGRWAQPQRLCYFGSSWGVPGSSEGNSPGEQLSGTE
jgi:hypothetical protein